jgi:hypothetical protein
MTVSHFTENKSEKTIYSAGIIRTLVMACSSYIRRTISGWRLRNNSSCVQCISVISSLTFYIIWLYMYTKIFNPCTLISHVNRRWSVPGITINIVQMCWEYYLSPLNRHPYEELSFNIYVICSSYIFFINIFLNIA